MYSKKSYHSLPPRKPEHYNGWAFQPPPPPGDHPPKKEEPPRAPAPGIHQSYPRPLPFLPPPELAPAPGKEDAPRPPALFPPSMEDLFGKSNFLSSLNFEELLLIGLIILLANNKEDGELPLLLALLLLC